MSAADALTALMSVSRTTGRWRLFVVVLGVPVSQWPEYVLDGDAVPSVQGRSRALEALGYAFTDAPGWEWTEDHLPSDDAAGPVRLIAAARVREVAS
ncbi:DUF6303 family protein [Streptomyces griseobrunneus]|uniref:DUF6303 family protein n=1 Tax=Streptomyces TaxID=1883 RepID=UPI001587A7B1|nr:DUF6303 family protein [Streptomyces sp. CAI-155]NUV84582.1 hypothetical protein [Streptomyces sp. CAI-155]